jgi:hypothetical protein
MERSGQLHMGPTLPAAIGGIDEIRSWCEHGWEGKKNLCLFLNETPAISSIADHFTVSFLWNTEYNTY